ncbi:MAG: hypothetical protein ACFFAS_08750 [Promethearchaeota archaeon]
MMFCELCKNPITENDIDSIVAFTLGDSNKGNFRPVGSLYYHRNCLRKQKPIKIEESL